jgi:choice-of-anchor B domain-containing protein
MCHDRGRLPALTRPPALLLVGASLWLAGCGGGSSDGMPGPDPVPSNAPAGEGLVLQAHLDLGALVGTAVAQHDEPLEIEGANSGAGNWGYTHRDGRRFALTGTSAGLSIVEVTNPRAPRNIGLVPGPASSWREVKTYREYVYVTTEAEHGLDIISMANPDAPRLVRTWNRTFDRAHTIWIDGDRGLAFVNGTRMRSTDTGMRVLDLASDPANPTEVGSFPGNAAAGGFYVHDSYHRGNVLFASAIFNGWVAMLDVADPTAIREIARFNTGGRFTHNSWLNGDGTVLFTTDERAGRPLEGWNITNPSAPVKVSEYIASPNSIPHNVMIDGNRLLVAHYTEGVHLLDISNPASPRRIASYDTYQGSSTGFNGCWGAYIFPNSGLIVASDMNSGLYVLEYQGR